ncbi:hypothetical protein FB45DRAFT_1052364 [Roridomyces roridus]|uniref:Transmembrane protein n=1 Tax=Roridomyces roridus TaxID=1738132 RepID=A0AAD7CGH1_9AGAR|nr:hypothetical protein FB45DRAFT_1052364 [Roridomyces roridus]
MSLFGNDARAPVVGLALEGIFYGLHVALSAWILAFQMRDRKMSSRTGCGQILTLVLLLLDASSTFQRPRLAKALSSYIWKQTASCTKFTSLLSVASNAIVTVCGMWQVEPTMSLFGNDARAPIVGLALEGMFYGFSVCMFGLSVWVLGFQMRERKMSSRMLVVSFVLWILSTIHVFAFTFHNESAIGPEVFLSDISGPISLLNNTVYCLQTLIGDAVLIYRCAVVWNRRDVIILPSMAWLASLGTLCFLLNSLAHGTFRGNEVVIFYAATLTANLLATCLLAFRIWRADQNARKLNSTNNNSLRPLLIVIIETGALYSVMLIMALVTSIHFLPMEYVVNGIVPSIISITFNMIFIRVGLGRRNHDQRQVQAGGGGGREFHRSSSIRFNKNSLKPADESIPATTMDLDSLVSNKTTFTAGTAFDLEVNDSTV